MGIQRAAVCAALFIACGPAQTTESKPTQPADAAGVLAKAEAALLAADAVKVEAHITATGAVTADLKVFVDMAKGNKLRFRVRGDFAGNKVQRVFISDGARTVFGSQVPASLNEAVVLGWTRMGLLHNVAVVLGGRVPDGASGGASTWVRADNVAFAPPATSSAANERAVSFDITVRGKPSGKASLTLEESSGKPVGRVQTVNFASGNMEVKESYKVTLGTPAADGTFAFAADCKGDENCLIQACSRGELSGCETFASQLVWGVGVTKDVKRAVNLSTHACKVGHAPSCLVAAYHLWHLYKKGKYMEAKRLHRRGKDLWRAECKLGFGPSCSELKLAGGGMRRLIGNTGRRHFSIGCKAGNGTACIQAARIVVNAWGVVPDKDHARSLLEPWCPKEREACYLLGRISQGEKAADWYAKACANGHTRSCGEAARLLRKLPARAADLAKIRADACMRRLHPDRYCVAAAAALPAGDPGRVRFLHQGCAVGGAESCVELAKLHAASKDKTAKRQTAEAWRLACQNGRTKSRCEAFIAAAKRAGMMRNRAGKMSVHGFACTAGEFVDSCRRAHKLGRGKPGAYHRTLCNKRDAKSCYLAGKFRESQSKGEPVAGDMVKHEAGDMYKRGCRLGDHLSCFAAGKLAKACDGGKGSYDACLAIAKQSDNVDGKDGTVTNARDNACRAACRAWKNRDRRDKRASGKNPKRAKICRKVKRCG